MNVTIAGVFASTNQFFGIMIASYYLFYLYFCCDVIYKDQSSNSFLILSNIPATEILKQLFCLRVLFLFAIFLPPEGI